MITKGELLDRIFNTEVDIDCLEHSIIALEKKVNALEKEIKPKKTKAKTVKKGK